MYGLIASIVAQASLVWVLSADLESQTATKGMLVSLTGTSLILVYQLLCALRAWLAICPEKEPQAPEDSWVDLCGSPRFDPAKGVYGEVLIDGKIHKVVIQPDYWHLLRSAINIDPNEAAVANSIVSSVTPGKEPGSLVCIQAADGKVLGMGARVHCGPNTVLVTAAHVLKAGRIADLYLAKYSTATKEGKRILMDPSWKLEYGSFHKEADVMAIQVPPQVWSRLGVTSTKVRRPAVKTPVVAFGGLSSGVLTSSQGFASPDGGFNLVHSCATEPGWSGTPLYAGSEIVGFHRRWEKIGSSNTAVNPSLFHSPAESGENAEKGSKEIDAEEWENREGTPDGIRIAGRGKFLVMGDEFSYEQEDPLAFDKYKKSKGQATWASMLDEDIDWDARMETAGTSGYYVGAPLNTGLPLNCQEAVSACSPPSSKCPESSGAVESSSAPQECPSLTVENRVSNLEKLLERVLINSAEMQSSNSVILQTLVGLKEDRKLKGQVSCSKQEGSDQQKPPETSKARAELSKESTPGPSSAAASGGNLGTKKASKRKSKKSRTVTSSGTPAQGSPSA